jgi:MFS family permease
MRLRLRKTFQSLAVRNYRLFATGQLVRVVGVWMLFVAQDWLVLQLSGDSATAVGITVAMQFTPVLLLTLISGALADRYDKRALLLVANMAFAGFAVVLALLVVADTVRLWHVYVTAAGLGIANAIESPTRQSFISELVAAKLLPNALSLSAAVFNVARILGPAAAGGAIALFGLGPAFLIASAAAITPMVSLYRMRAAEFVREPLLPRADRERVRVGDGLRYVWRRHDLLFPIVMLMVIGCIGFNFNVTLPVLSKVEYGTSSASFGLLVTALSVGSLAGALGGSWRRSRPSAYLVLGAAFTFGVFAILVGLATSYWLVLILLLPTGFAAVLFGQAANMRVLLGSDPAFRGRVMAIYVLVLFGSTPLGALGVGWWSEKFGAASAILLGGLGSLLTAVVGLAWQLRRHGERLRLQIRPPRLVVVEQGGTGRVERVADQLVQGHAERVGEQPVG